MADSLGFISPVQFQLPGPAQIQQQPGLVQGLASGLNQGAQLGQYQQALQQKQQELAMQQHQNEIQKNMKMLEVGADMVINGGSDESLERGQDLISRAYPFITGQPLPQGVPIDKNVAKGVLYYKNAVDLFHKDPTNPLALSPEDAITGFTGDIQRYGMKQQQAKMDILKSQPFYKEGMANQIGGVVNGEPALKNEYTGAVSSPSGKPMLGAEGSFIDAGQAATMKQTNKNNISNDFKADAESNADVLETASNALNMISHPVPSNLTDEQKASIALQDKNALMKYAQVLIPASKRPPNMTMEDMLTSGLVKEIGKELWNHVSNGIPMTEEERSAVTNTLGREVLNHEGQLTAKENSHAGRAAFNQVNPLEAFSDKRPPGVPSTSQFFKSNQLPSAHVHTGQIMRNPNDGEYYVFRGQTGTNDWQHKGNWMKIK